MKTIKLHTALKIKNRLAGEVTRVQEILRRENARRNDSVSKVDRAALFNVLTETREKLVKLKSEIAKANVPVYPLLARMEELKSYIAFLAGLPVREGPEVVPSISETLSYVWASHINQEEKDKLLAETQEEINNLQDEVDAINASITIEVDI